ncbi:hypothetical protein Anas_05841 [Armadillidium nasatum]|uniref:alpha-L-fucosidase n=1 Tax=Armadillidium nasatum TaxID=96803 RepID=A0A5N5TJL5_9CRUS|nr:hypothetical protein Anas_05841 [Armadillidium nasatum]
MGTLTFGVLSLLLLVSTGVFGQYTPDWESLDSRPLPEWYDQAKIGIFLHWGLYSVPSFGSEWFWSNWEGFTMWPSKYSFSWNAMDLGPKRDLLGDLASAIRNKTSLRFGLYHSLYEWFNPLYINDKANNYQTSDFVNFKTLPELYEVTELYEPDVIWSDGEWEADDWYWNSTVFLAWLFNESPVKDTVVVNDRWGGNDILCQHGSFYTCTDRYNPGVLQPHKWENCMTLDKNSWGFDRTATLSEYLTIEELLETLITTISCGGNLLVNTGPTLARRMEE